MDKIRTAFNLIIISILLCFIKSVVFGLHIFPHSPGEFFVCLVITLINASALCILFKL